MTAMKMGIGDTFPISAVDAKAACELVLTSEMFGKAPRMVLLRFLVDKAVSGAVLDLTEYAIGIEVFGRDPGSYSTTEDPIVRVQIGRLREKLNAYYATRGADDEIRIAIPLGSYIPNFRRVSRQQSTVRQGSMLAIHPFNCISSHKDGLPFTQGLYDEVVHQSFKAFGRSVISHLVSAETASAVSKNRSAENVNHRLEGSVQIDGDRIRTSIRLIDVTAGCVAWSEQFDRNAFFAIAIQEELAMSICGALKRYFCQEQQALQLVVA